MSKLKIGGKAIPFALPGVDDQEHSLADYADKEVVAVVFSCNHCPYVLAWEDRMIQIQADYADKGEAQDTVTKGDCRYYMVRGTDWGSDARDLRFSYREGRPENFSSNRIGFRVVRDVDSDQ